VQFSCWIIVLVFLVFLGLLFDIKVRVLFRRKKGRSLDHFLYRSLAWISLIFSVLVAVYLGSHWRVLVGFDKGGFWHFFLLTLLCLVFLMQVFLRIFNEVTFIKIVAPNFFSSFLCFNNIVGFLIGLFFLLVIYRFLAEVFSGVF
jgi:hypothetical protein